MSERQDNEQAAAEARRLVGEFFKDEEKTALWFNTCNPQFGRYVKPQDLIDMGRADKLLRTVKLMLEENNAPPQEKPETTS